MNKTEQIRANHGERRDVVLEVAEVRAGYGDLPVLHGASLELHEGEAVGIVGHNGSGKTTLLKTIVGHLPVKCGRVMIDGNDVTRSPAHQRARLGIGYVPQGRGILPGLSALENLRIAWSPTTGETEQQSLDRILTSFPRLNSILDRKGGSLSGGEQQILALGRAMMPDPWLLLLDEPSEGIQPSIVEEIGQVLLSLHREHSLSLIIVEQNLDLVLDVADRVLVFERGRVEQQFSAGELQAGAIAELLGMGSGRMTRADTPPPRPGGAATQKPRISQLAPTVTGAAVTAVFQAARHQAAPVNEVSDTRSVQAKTARAAPSSAKPPKPPAAGESMSTVKRPTLEQLKGIVASLHMNMSEREVAEYLEVLEGTFKSYDRVAELPDNLPEVRYPRTPGYRPGADENPLGAWAVKSVVKGAAHGPLSGKEIVLKDNVCLAGVPMMNGARTLEGYTPDLDATIVTRMLDAGATIVGKAHCESF